MNLWHATPDTPRIPAQPSSGQTVFLRIGTWPIQPGQKVWVQWRKISPTGNIQEGRTEAEWETNSGPNSYWVARLDPMDDGVTVDYTIRGLSTEGKVQGPSCRVVIGAKIHLAILWHHHQPLYSETAKGGEIYRLPWVRLHAIRDYYSMADLVSHYPKVHLTINLVPSLLFQIEGYTQRQATDHALNLTLKPSSRLTYKEQEQLLSTFFDADWHNQIYIHPPYKELFEKRVAGKTFSLQEMTDLQMWFNLAWFAPEFSKDEVQLHDGTRIQLNRFYRKGRGFSQTDIRAMVDAQLAILRNIVPLHRAMQEFGQIEISTTPFFHPILPLIHDSDQATIDRSNALLPERFHFPEDAEAQVLNASEFYKKRFGQPPLGMWPAEGAIGPSVVNHFVNAGIRWIATDQGVLERSGRWGYRVEEPDVLCQPYRVEDESGAVSVFFRDRLLSDAIGFKYHAYTDQAQAAKEFINEIKGRLASKVTQSANRVVTVILDGENAWGSYPKAARPFFHALYQALSDDSEIKTTTFTEYLNGNATRGIFPHFVHEQTRVFDLFQGSWIDEWGSQPGVDLGTWIGEKEENDAWNLLKTTREALSEAKVSLPQKKKALEAIYAAEGSDWFWWFGDDQESGYDDVFDDLFRGHLRRVYEVCGLDSPAILGKHIVSHAVNWTFTRPVLKIQRSDRLTIHTHCAGLLHWSWDQWRTVRQTPLGKVGGVMAGLHFYSVTLSDFPQESEALEFLFQCTECDCQSDRSCCGAARQKVFLKGGK